MKTETPYLKHHTINVKKEDKINMESIKKLMTEKKTTLPSLKNQDWKKDKVETEKINKLSMNIPWTSSLN